MDAQGNLYYATGNGTWDGITDFSDSVVKLKARTLELLDWFTPYNYDMLNINDWDLSSSFPVILPELNMLVIAGKGGKMYMLNSDNLGRVVDQDAQIPQSWEMGPLRQGIAAWRGPYGLTVYSWTVSDTLRSYRFDPATMKFIFPNIAQSTVAAFEGVLTISSDGDKAGTGIVWVTTPLARAWPGITAPGRFLAFSTEDVGGQIPLLWASDDPKDDMHNFSKSSPPLVVNGRVYVPSLSNAISIYGLNAP
jgi:hypothetical protein